ncbi:sensor histidine kinase [Aequorivita lipolytica]|uniref:histidine kinase n=1 Tax=Aequorivita lipolytica TaxID=153267 RepID=A0A5C6YNR7_9FLAO|nr:ATP-binding protein [Aequorivita lipolytica]TXD68865.1 histidine kinase [Aequorivita lipolytica]SRX52126.1 Oxygen sensor histidine kinase NreB [Aequorivita lipolytica]
MDEKEIIIIAAIAIPISLVVIVIVLFSVFTRRKNRLLEEQEKAKKDFDRELAESQIEIREETLRNISWELHDNIGQLMTLAKIQAQMAQEKPEMMKEVSETIGTGLNELRALSKLINPEALKSLSLKEAVGLEIERFNRLKFIAAELTVKGTVTPIESNIQIILFRILQEFFSNTIKHSKASTLKVLLDYSDNVLTILAEDNGVGFEKTDNFMGIGLKNMKTRAQLINSTLKIKSVKSKGTALHLKYKFT